MPIPIRIDLGGVELKGQFLDNTAGQALAQGLPFEVGFSRWGEEYYGTPDQPFGQYEGEAGEVMAVGDLAYHGDNSWFCIFFGPTPASQGGEPRAAAPVIKVGAVSGDWEAVKALPAMVTATVSAA